LTITFNQQRDRAAEFRRATDARSPDLIQSTGALEDLLIAVFIGLVLRFACLQGRT
jgi:hypothetical protein